MNRVLAGVAAGLIVLAGLAGAVIAPRLKHKDGVAVGGPFALVDGAGHAVTDQDFRGRWMLLYFGYTHCPDACPTTLGDIAAALDKLPPADRAQAAPLFITVDPERDTPAVMGDYVKAFGPAFTGLTGSAAAVSDVEEKYRVFAQKHPLKGGGYAMDHSSIIYVVGPGGSLAGILDDTLAPAAMAEQLRKLGV